MVPCIRNGILNSKCSFRILEVQRSPTLHNLCRNYWVQGWELRPAMQRRGLQLSARKMKEGSPCN
ncbi:Protein of unknown function [Gryllus bimaculatus]|nr:Protein of unknown function [Gryllus bimaculatus]